MKIYGIILTIAMVWILVVACSGLFNMGMGNPPKIGEIAPDFEITTIEGQPVKLSQYRGKAVLVNFWAVWCYPCVEEMPLLQQRYLLNHPDLVILAIEDNSPSDEIKEIVMDKGMTFLVAKDAGSLQGQYGITAFPTSFFIDSDGIVQSKVIGDMSPEQIDLELAKIGIGD